MTVQHLAAREHARRSAAQVTRSPTGTAHRLLAAWHAFAAQFGGVERADIEHVFSRSYMEAHRERCASSVMVIL